MTEKIRCPFCGNMNWWVKPSCVMIAVADTEVAGPPYRVVCKLCGAEGPAKSTKKEALTAYTEQRITYAEACTIANGIMERAEKARQEFREKIVDGEQEELKRAIELIRGVISSYHLPIGADKACQEALKILNDLLKS